MTNTNDFNAIVNIHELSMRLLNSCFPHEVSFIIPHKAKSVNINRTAYVSYSETVINLVDFTTKL